MQEEIYQETFNFQQDNTEIMELLETNLEINNEILHKIYETLVIEGETEEENINRLDYIIQQNQEILVHQEKQTDYITFSMASMRVNNSLQIIIIVVLLLILFKEKVSKWMR